MKQQQIVKHHPLGGIDLRSRSVNFSYIRCSVFKSDG